MASPRVVLFFVFAAFLDAPITAPAAEAPPEIFSVADRSRRLALLYRTLAAAGPTGGPQWIARIDRSPACAARDDDRRLAVEFWAQSDPSAALAYVASYPTTPHDRLVLQEAVARGWTRAAPDAALHWSEEQPFAGDVDLTKAVLETLAETAPPLGMHSLRQAFSTPGADRAGDSRHSEQAFAFLRRLIDLGDYAECRRLVEDFPAGETKNQLLYFVADRMAEFAPTGTAEWARSRSARADAFYPLAAIAAGKAAQDIATALDWVLATEDATLRAKLVRVAAGTAVDHQPSLSLVEKILARLPAAPERHAAYAAFAASEDLVRLSPRQIVDWAAEIATNDERRLALVQAYAHWHDFDAENATRHLAATDRLRPADRAAVETFLGLKPKRP